MMRASSTGDISKGKLLCSLHSGSPSCPRLLLPHRKSSPAQGKEKLAWVVLVAGSVRVLNGPRRVTRAECAPPAEREAAGDFKMMRWG